MQIDDLKKSLDINIPIPPTFQGVPFGFQKVGATFLAYQHRSLLGDSMGLGKTVQCILAMCFLQKLKQLPNRVLIVTVNSAVYQWQQEFEKFAPDFGPEIVTAEYTPEERQYFYNTMAVKRVVITSYSIMRIDCAELCQLGFDLIIFDEAAVFKNYKSKTFTAAQTLSRPAEFVWAATAYPMPNNPEELFGVYSIIRPYLFGLDVRGKYYLGITKFREQFENRLELVNRRGQRFWKLLGYRNLDRLRFMIDQYYIGRTYQDVEVQVPDLLIKECILEMTPNQRQAYNQVEEGLVNTVDTEEILAKFVALQQISNGMDIKEQVLNLDIRISPKIEEIKRFLENDLEQEKVVIFSKFRSFIDVLQSELARYHPVRITGEESLVEREENKTRFEGDDSCRVLLMTQAGGFALNLQVAKAIIFVDLPFSFGMLEQIMGRIRRIGSTHTTVLAILLMMRDSIDNHVLNILRSKKKVIENVMGHRDVLDDTPVVSDIKAIRESRLKEYVNM